MGKKKRIWASKEERDAWEAHVDETLRNLRELAERAKAKLDAKQAES
jgi:hypothetical protein